MAKLHKAHPKTRGRWSNNIYFLIILIGILLMIIVWLYFENNEIDKMGL
ncbi:MAG: hypothetical protein ACQUHE_02890 [Bacteroidia bacterium]